MDQMTSYEALVFPSDDRPPHLVALVSTPITPVPNPPEPYRCARLPHPQVYMDYVADEPGAWRFHLVEALDGMKRKFDTPYIIFYPVISRDSMPFPINKCIREIQGNFYKESRAWRGNIVVAKYKDQQYSAMIDMSMADFPLVKNYLQSHYTPST
ncbi:hypothetical protein C8Q75DRAFT_273887 [Abortiporus biennis]|nr:hypothetical protein C8Q75DRAFT_273887 [Abortiporus biennis]